MSLDILLTIAVLLGAMALFVSEKLGVDVIAMLVLAALLLLGLVTPQQALSGFASEATITVAAMFVLSHGLTRTGALREVARLFDRLRTPGRFTLVVMLCLGALSAFVNNTAAMAVFLPLVLASAARNRFPASKVLIPMSYAAQMGGVCTLIGTSTNLLVNSLARDLGHPGFGLFDFSLLGLITMAVGISFVMLLGRHLLPSHRQGELSEAYELGKYMTELRVLAGSPLIGQSVAEARLGERFGVYVLELLRGEEKLWSPRAEKLRADDILLVRGDWQRLIALRDETRLVLEPEFTLHDAQFDAPGQVLTEAMVAPGSRFAGHSLRELDFQWHYNATVLAIHRRGEVLRNTLREARLNVGDVLLMLAKAEELPHLRRNRNLIVLGTREEPGGQRRRAWLAMAIMAAVVGAAALGWLPIVTSAILGCLALVLTGCLGADEIYEAIDWRVVVLLAGVLPLGIALQQSGAAGLLVEGTLGLLGDSGPLLALAVVYLLTALLTEAMSNNATAVLMVPIAFATGEALGVDPTPFLVAVAFAASTSFATPVGYQTNTMVYSVGGYRFSDFLRIGVPLNLVFWALAVGFIPIFFPF